MGRNGLRTYRSSNSSVARPISGRVRSTTVTAMEDPGAGSGSDNGAAGADSGRARGWPGRGARRRAGPGGLRNRGGGRAGGGSRAEGRDGYVVALKKTMSDYPDDLRELVEDYLEQLRFSQIRADRGSRGGDALLAARRGQADPAGARARDGALDRARSRARAARGRGARADPHLLPDPRRPAGDGRRRAATRHADLARQVRRERRDPRRRRSLRRGDAPVHRASRRATRPLCWPRSGS